MNLPQYRAKKLGSDEWVEGYLFGIWDKYYILWGTTNHVPNQIEIDPSTLAIHFPDMLDSEGNKIFASLSKDGRGGSIVVDGLSCGRVCYYKNGEFTTSKYVLSNTSGLKVICIQE